MQITFDPTNPREVADVMSLLRLLGQIDAAVCIRVDDEPTMSEAEAKRLQPAVLERARHWRKPHEAEQKPASDLSSLNLDLEL